MLWVNLHITASQSYGNPLLTDLDIILCNASHFKEWFGFFFSHISVSTLGEKNYLKLFCVTQHKVIDFRLKVVISSSQLQVLCPLVWMYLPRFPIGVLHSSCPKLDLPL